MKADTQWFGEDMPLAPQTNDVAAKAVTVEALTRLARAHAAGAPIGFDPIGAIVERHFEHAKVIRFDQRPPGPGKPPPFVADTAGSRAGPGFTDSISVTEGPRRYGEAMA